MLQHGRTIHGPLVGRIRVKYRYSVDPTAALVIHFTRLSITVSRVCRAPNRIVFFVLFFTAPDKCAPSPEMNRIKTPFHYAHFTYVFKKKKTPFSYLRRKSELSNRKRALLSITVPGWRPYTPTLHLHEPAFDGLFTAISKIKKIATVRKKTKEIK